MPRNISALLFVTMVGTSSVFASPPSTKLETPVALQNLAQAALLGMQLSVKQGHQAGKVPSPVANCVAALKPDSFVPVYDALLKSKFTPTEQQATEEFLKGPVGSKYAKYGLLQIYLIAGEKTPEALPTFSAAEMKTLEAFSKTPAGDKLMMRKVMQSPAAAQAVKPYVSQLLSQCERGQ